MILFVIFVLFSLVFLTASFFRYPFNPAKAPTRTFSIVGDKDLVIGGDKRQQGPCKRGNKDLAIAGSMVLAKEATMTLRLEATRTLRLEAASVSDCDSVCDFYFIVSCLAHTIHFPLPLGLSQGANKDLPFDCW